MDRPDEVRRVVSFKRLALTDFKIEIPRLARKTVLKAALEESGKLTLGVLFAVRGPAHEVCLLFLKGQAVDKQELLQKP